MTSKKETVKKEDIEKAAKEDIQKQERGETQQPKKSLGNIKDGKPEEEIKEQKKDHIGWKNVPLETLPSQGLFYPKGTKIAIRAANVKEIRHWSTIDESDGLAIDDTINYVIERCVQMVIPGKRAFFKDLKEIDRFYLLFAIREFTFKNGENKLFTDVPLKSGGNQRIEVTKDIISYFNPPEKLMKFYSETEHCFVFTLSTGEKFKMYIPSIGITSFLKKYREEKNQNRQAIDEDFEKYCLFLFDDWRGLTKEIFDKEQQASNNWSLEKISVASSVVELIRNSVNPTITATVDSGEEVTVPLSFQGGLKAIFVISNILDELV